MLPQAFVRRSRKGAILVTLLVAITALLGVFALAVDVTRIHVAAQRAQAVADASAFAGGQKLPSPTLSTGTALSTAEANIEGAAEWPTTVDDGDVTCYEPGSTIYRPDGSVLTVLGSSTHALMAVAHVTVDYAFGGLLGLGTSVATRCAVVVRGAANGLNSVPIWISAGSPELGVPGANVNLLKTGKVEGEVPPGSFGFLDFSVPGNDSWFRSNLSGYDVSDAVREAAFVQTTDTLTAYTGEHTGQWTQALANEVGQLDGTARLERAEADPTWSTESPVPTTDAEGNVTWSGFSRDNPRLIAVPIVQYSGSNGANATFSVVGFAEMWLVSVGNKSIEVKFLQYNYFSGGGGDLDPDAGGSGTVFIVRPIA
jgi:hypothetical protein